MMKVIACLLVAVVMLSSVTAFAAQGRGGFMGLFLGCCYGARSAAAWNDGKSWPMQEWGLLIPFFNIYIAIVNGVNGMNGLTTNDLAAQYGSQYY